MDIKWISLFSQTGGEIALVSERIGRFPDVILTNNMEYSGNLPNVIKLTAAGIRDWLLDDANVEVGSLITAHGYLRIIPESVIEFLRDKKDTCIFNGHPALITKYPELVGKDPQKRVYAGIMSGKYDKIGTVIHVMDSGVDTGSIVMGNMADIPPIEITEESVTRALYQLSGDLWTHFIQVALGEAGITNGTNVR